MFVSNIIRTKGTEVHTVKPEATADDAVQELVRYNVGSLVVCEPDAHGRPRMVGIITERDLLRAQAAHRKPLEKLVVHEVMSRDVVTTTLEETLPVAMRLMTAHRIRHLPVVDEGRLRDFFGFNRAKHAVVEAAILATRIAFLSGADNVVSSSR